jgi:hypothetical protein
MGCCGDKSRWQAINDIAGAYSRHVVAKFIPSGLEEEFTRRCNICRECEHRTWLSVADREKWLFDNMGQILWNPHRIAEKTEELPRNHLFREGDSPYCTACRCACIVKARLPSAVCCKDLWTGEDDHGR